MSFRAYLLLGALGLALALLISRYQSFPGYMDSDYYFAGGIQLAQGKGFNEPYIWNYLDDPTGLPHPSHSYWMPLASILAALGMWLTGSTQYWAGRLAFIALAAVVPAVTARLALEFSGRAFPAIVSGLLAVFSIYYAPFLAVPDNYAVYLILGALFVFVAARRGRVESLSMGLIAGVMTLARSDGILWLFLGAVACVSSVGGWNPSIPVSGTSSPLQRQAWVRLGLLAVGFLIAAAPWMLRNLQVYGAIRAPGAERLLWLTTYNEIFTYPASSLTPEALWHQGLAGMLGTRFSALRWNLLNAVAAQGGIFLLPFILIGVWEHRGDLRVRLGVVGWFVLLGVMTLALPAVGARGGWFHAGAGLQVLWWCLAPLGLETVINWARRRRLFTDEAQHVFGVGLVCIAAIMTSYILWLRVVPGWGEGEDRYPTVEQRLVASGARTEDVVMVRNPPGYYIMTGRAAIAIPYADSSAMLLAARKYGADYLVIEELGAVGPIRAVYDDLHSENLEFLGEEDGTRLFRILP